MGEETQDSTPNMLEGEAEGLLCPFDNDGLNLIMYYNDWIS